MNGQFVALSSLAMDLKRAALGFHRGSDSKGARFLKEAMERRAEVDRKRVPGYILNILEDMKKEKDGERLLMYSTLIQNYLKKNE